MKPLWALLVVACSCATVSKPDLEQFKPTIEAFHQKLRWKDFRAAADIIVPERRDTFLRARTKSKDEKDLFVTDFQLDDAFMGVGTTVAKAVTKISWYRLPSASEETATLTSVWTWREGRWMLESVDAGPFPDLLGPPPAPNDKLEKTVKAPDRSGP